MFPLDFFMIIPFGKVLLLHMALASLCQLYLQITPENLNV